MNESATLGEDKPAYDLLTYSNLKSDETPLLNMGRFSLSKQRSISDSRLYIESNSEEKSSKSIPAQKNKQNFALFSTFLNKNTELRKKSDDGRYLKPEKR